MKHTDGQAGPPNFAFILKERITM